MSEQKRYVLADLERQHVGEVKQQIEHFEARMLQLDGEQMRIQRELSFMRRHLSLFFGQLANRAGLPMGARLTPDGAALVVEAVEAEKITDAMAG